MGLVVFCYFCHLVSLGLTVLGMVVLAVATPSNGRSRSSRLAATALTLTPLLVLAPIYLSLSRQKGGTPPFPVWNYLSKPWLPSSWPAQLGWVDPLSLMSKTALPFTERTSLWFAALSPALWTAAAVGFWIYGEVRRPTRRWDELRGWWVLAILLVLGGYFGPDSFGPDHGEYLPQRLVLLGLAALVPVFDPDPSTRSGRASIGALVIALTLQSLIVWDYAVYSGRTAGTFASARGIVGRGRRVGTLLAETKSRFRANPLLHADNWLGVETGNIVWSNYETRYYYFPVHFKEGLTRPDPRALENLSLAEGPGDQKARARDWARLLGEHAEAIDVLVCWKEAPRLDEVTERWFEPAGSLGNLRIYRKRPKPSGSKK